MVRSIRLLVIGVFVGTIAALPFAVDPEVMQRIRTTFALGNLGHKLVLIIASQCPECMRGACHGYSLVVYSLRYSFSG